MASSGSGLMLTLLTVGMVAFTHKPDDLLRHLKTATKSAVSPADCTYTRLTLHCGTWKWTVAVDPGLTPTMQSCETTRCPPGDVEITVTPDALAALLERRLSPIAAVVQGRVKIDGDGTVLRSKAVAWLWDTWKGGSTTETHSVHMRNSPGIWIAYSSRAARRMLRHVKRLGRRLVLRMTHTLWGTTKRLVNKRWRPLPAHGRMF